MADHATAGDRAPGPPSVRVYRRVVRSSLERVWENVRDWEHLPWLHRTTFRSIECIRSDESGWRAKVEYMPALGSGTAEVELDIDLPSLSYVTRTLSGTGAGTDIITTLESIDAASTKIVVDFRVPDLAPEHATVVGDALESLYAGLWDEDEAMMKTRQRVLDRERGAAVSEGAVRLGPPGEVRGRAPFLVEIDGHEARVLAHEGTFLAYSTRCPHLGGPLGDCEIVDGVVECPWHGYRFDVVGGASSDGRGLRLGPAFEVVAEADSGDLILRRKERV